MNNQTNAIESKDLDETNEHAIKIELVPEGKIVKRPATNLKFENVTEITYLLFLRESSYFIINYLFFRIPAVTFYGFFRVVGDEKLIGLVAFPLLTMDLFYSGIRDFQETIGIICGPFLSKGDNYNYRLNRNRLIFLNTLLYCMSMMSALFLYPMYRLMGVKDESIDQIVTFSMLYIFIYGPLMTITNFLKGKFW